MSRGPPPPKRILLYEFIVHDFNLLSDFILEMYWKWSYNRNALKLMQWMSNSLPRNPPCHGDPPPPKRILLYEFIVHDFNLLCDFILEMYWKWSYNRNALKLMQWMSNSLPRNPPCHGDPPPEEDFTIRIYCTWF